MAALIPIFTDWMAHHSLKQNLVQKWNRYIKDVPISNRYIPGIVHKTSNKNGIVTKGIVFKETFNNNENIFKSDYPHCKIALNKISKRSNRQIW